MKLSLPRLNVSVQEIIQTTFLQTCLILGPRCPETGDSVTDDILSGDPGKGGSSGNESPSNLVGLPKGVFTGLPVGVEPGLGTERLCMFSSV